MAFSAPLPAPLVAAGLPRLRLPRAVAPATALLVCLLALGSLGRTALADGTDSAGPTGPVSVAVHGVLSTAGLAANGATVSRVVVTNDGHAPLRWSWTPAKSRPPALADRVRMSVWAAPSAGCAGADQRGDTAAPLVAPDSISPAALAPGASLALCVRLALTSAPGTTAGTVLPRLQVDAVGLPH